MRKIKLVLEYDGTGLSGWQRQDNGITVQEHVETALARLFQQPIKLQGASRTDAGVHAAGQVAHFHAPKPIALHGIRRGLNGYLPDAIAIVSAEQVDDNFHARFSATGKHYRYDVWCRPERSPLLRDRVWHRPRALDIAAMTASGAVLVGKHDFAAFRAAGCSAKTTTREVSAIDVARLGDLVRIDVRGTAFLRNMVRIIAGTLVEAGQHKRTAASVAIALATKDRRETGQTAPARGLTLMEVLYGRKLSVV